MLFKQIRADFLSARKRRHTNESNLLSLIVSELESNALYVRDANGVVQEKTVKDAQVIAAVRKVSANLRDLISVKTAQNRSTAEELEQILILNRYIPEQISEQKLIEISTEFDHISKFFTHLEQNYPGQYDRKAAAQLFNK